MGSDVTIRIFDGEQDLAAAAARLVADTVRARPAAVLGLPTGRTPVELYGALVALVEAGRLDLSAVTTFNLDEFVGLSSDDPRGYRAFMDRHLFGPAGIRDGQVRFLDGSADDLEAECARYERAIDAAGGIDLQLLGIGVNGHIGFNEPADGLHARTHVAVLHDETRRANAALFGGVTDAVPVRALSMGMATILGARAIVVLATGAEKAAVVRQAIEGPVTTAVPASFLQLHSAVTWLVDEAAAHGLSAETRAAALANADIVSVPR